MKKIISIGLIFMMSAQCLYKMGIITYYHLNRKYIAEVLCINKEEPITMCHGKCFLKQTLALETEAPQAPGAPSNEKIEIPVFLISQSLYAFTASSESSALNSAYSLLYTLGYSSPPFRPPSI